MTEIVFKEKYLSSEEMHNINMFYDTMNFGYGSSKGPYKAGWLELGWQGCWDTSARLHIESNPVHVLTERLQKDFGKMIFWRASLRHFHAPFDVHDDYPYKERDIKKLESLGIKHSPRVGPYESIEGKIIPKGYTFLVPTWWEKGYNAGTAFFNAPPKDGEPLYEDCQEVLPKFNEEHYRTREVKNRIFSVRQIVNWKNVGDLIGWENYTLHCSTHTPNWEYSRDKVVKRFLSIDCFIDTKN
tara:strand:- start:3015 stop:3740 length:726 start_codon:yes stop_codon:yes gene_type:complete